jgi:hypothetical protein
MSLIKTLNKRGPRIDLGHSFMDVSPATQYSVNLLEDWHEALDKNQYVATVLITFSYTFEKIGNTLTGL